MSLPFPLVTMSIISASLNFCASGDRRSFTLSFRPFVVLPEPSLPWQTAHLSRYTSWTSGAGGATAMDACGPENHRTNARSGAAASVHAVGDATGIVGIRFMLSSEGCLGDRRG